MNKIQLLSLVFVMVAGSLTAEAQRQTAHKANIVRKTTLQYLAWLPDGYNKKNAEGYPLLIFLHGSGERGSDLELVKKNGPPSFVESKPGFQFILISPQCPSGSRWVVEDLQLLFEKLLKQYNIDPSRVYLTGLSMGGFGTWSWACRYPGQFAAVAPVCGGGDVQYARELVHVPVWAFHGEQDPVVPASRSIEMVEAVNARGGKALITVYPGIGHDSWIQAYSNDDLYRWMLSNKLEIVK